MSRIADALQKSRTENPGSDQTAGRDLQPLRPLAQVQIPWFLGETTSAVLAPPTLEPEVTEAPAHPDKPRALVTPPRTEAPPKPARNDEAVAGLIRNIFQVRTANERAVRRLLFTSVDDTRCSIDIAPRVAEALAAQSNRSVCLADLDLHSPTLHNRVPAIEGQRGFADAVGGTRSAARLHARRAIALQSLAAARRRPDARRDSAAQRSRHTASARRSAGDVLLRDRLSPHPSASTTTPRISALVFDGVILVVDASATKSTVVRAAAQSLEQANVRLLGTVLSHPGSSGAAS